ncbi:hypothetical protein SDC9_126327 [bioreactor metagenome]|uniref:Uncharacterized protein n=1 Tax=bioreactor metagenome TaxID=1076179 RepID=A0A645CQY3_9ZZZZ
MTTDVLRVIDPELSRQTESPAEIYALLRERIARYTMGDSTSGSVGTARRLLEGLLYCADLCRRMPPNDLATDAPLSARVKAGSEIAKRLEKRAKLLLYEATRLQPPIRNRSFQDTLHALPSFFRGYDADFFAQEIPCSFDYPLCHPVSDALLGVEYMLDYLRRWLVESRFLRAFSEDSLRTLYERYYIDSMDLLVNLFLPVAEMATLCALAGAPIGRLALAPAEYASVGQLLLQMDEQAAQRYILAASDRAVAQLGLDGEPVLEEMRQTARDLLFRLRAGFDSSRLIVFS